MDHLDFERDDPNILEMDFEKFLKIKSLLDVTSIREAFMGALPREIFSTNTYQLMDVEGFRGNMSPGKWLLMYLGNRGGRVSDLINLFQQINLEQALLYLREEEPLWIIEQPASNITVYEGEVLHISCNASGYPHPEYQWLKDDEELLLEGGIQVLSIPSAKVEDSGIYVCKVSKINADLSVSSLDSDPATVVVLPRESSNLVGFSRQNSDQRQLSSIGADVENIEIEPNEIYEQNILSRECSESEKIIIVKQPRSYGKVNQGANVKFKCLAEASHPVNYQWCRDGRPLNGQTSTELSIDELYPDKVTGNRKLTFFCRVYNEYDEVTSDFATVELSKSDEKTKYVAEEKIAFLIANDKYENDLVTPAADVADLTKLLESINFKVIVFRNLNLREMISTFQAFCRQLNTDSYVVVFFAGHGFECDGQTYLQPIDCSENLLPEESMCTEYILQEIQETGPDLIVLLIDTCRKRCPDLGTVQIKKYDASMRNNTVYGYATSFLNGAYESAGRNSFFVKYLKKHITHDISIREILQNVQRDFYDDPQTRNLQYPVIESSLSIDRKLCDELRNPPDVTTYQLPCWFYRKRNPLVKQTQIIGKLKCCFIVEVKDHMDVYLNGVDVNLYIDVKEDANLDDIRKSGIVVFLCIPGLQVRKSKGVSLQNIDLELGAKIGPIIKEEVLELQRFQNAELKVTLLLKVGENEIPKEFSFTIEKIRSMDSFFL